MADTRVQLEVEDWVREHWMQEHFGQPFNRKRLKLCSGGVFDFDAVSQDLQIVASISSSGGKTSSGKLPVGKLMKIRSDMLFLTMIDTKRRIVVLIDADMLKLCQKEVDGGRVPDTIEFLRAEIPEELKLRLHKAQETASKEVSPQ